jgi:hypothetical protein
VLAEKDYQNLTEIPDQSTLLLDWMFNKPAAGTRTPDIIKQRLQEECNAWD